LNDHGHGQEDEAEEPDWRADPTIKTRVPVFQMRVAAIIECEIFKRATRVIISFLVIIALVGNSLMLTAIRHVGESAFVGQRLAT
jgi:hypothetical protein